MISEVDIRYLLELLSDEMFRREGSNFGYAKDPQIARLQATLSVMLEAARP
jgi:hypothetical protein